MASRQRPPTKGLSLEEILRQRWRAMGNRHRACRGAIRSSRRSPIRLAVVRTLEGVPA